MKAIILLNGEPYQGKINAENAHVYCCDGAYDWAKNKVRIDETLGDFDSLSYLPDPPPSEVYPSEKDFTDGELALHRALKAGCSEIEIYGGGGKREDHFIGNLHLLYAAAKAGAHAELITDNARIFAAEGHVSLKNLRGTTLSISPFGGNAHIMKAKGLHYPLPETFSYGSTIGISNVVESDDAEFVSEGTVLVFINRS